MGELAGHSGKEVVKKLISIGYRIVRQRGSHIRLVHGDGENFKPLTVPAYKEIGVGLLRQIIKDAHLSVEDFLAL